MQDRYTGDIGDFYKYGLMRVLAPGHRLGLAWYLYPDETHNDDGRHVAYLSAAETWRHLDPELFDKMAALVRMSPRRIAAVERSGLLQGCIFSGRRLHCGTARVAERRVWRRQWFQSTLADLKGCDIVLTDPDNGLCDPDTFRPGRMKDWKRMPLDEARAIAQGRTAVLYHHNSRFKGGHEAEIALWLDRLGGDTMALRCRAYSARTYFIVNPTPVIRQRVTAFAARWEKAELFQPPPVA